MAILHGMPLRDRFPSSGISLYHHLLLHSLYPFFVFFGSYSFFQCPLHPLTTCQSKTSWQHTSPKLTYPPPKTCKLVQRRKEESPQGYSCNNITNKNLDVFSGGVLMNSGASQNKECTQLAVETREQNLSKALFYRHVHEVVHSMWLKVIMMMPQRRWGGSCSTTRIPGCLACCCLRLSSR